MIKEYSIVFSTYHDTVVARIEYNFNEELFISNLYTIPEINNIIALWKENSLCGSFGIHPLSPSAICILKEKE